MTDHAKKELEKKAIAFLKEHAVYVTQPLLDAKGNFTGKESRMLYIDYSTHSMERNEEQQELVQALLAQHDKDCPLPYSVVNAADFYILPKDHPDSQRMLNTLRENFEDYHFADDDRIYRENINNFCMPLLERMDISGANGQFTDLLNELPHIAIKPQTVVSNYKKYQRQFQEVREAFGDAEFIPVKQAKGKYRGLSKEAKRFLERDNFKKVEDSIGEDRLDKEQFRIIQPHELANTLLMREKIKELVGQAHMLLLDSNDRLEVTYPAQNKRGVP